MHARTPVAVAVAAGVIGLHAAQDPGTALPARFEVAFLRCNLSGDPGSRLRRQPGGRFMAVNVALARLITLAHAIQPYQLVDMPDWVDADARLSRGPAGGSAL